MIIHNFYGIMYIEIKKEVLTMKKSNYKKVNTHCATQYSWVKKNKRYTNKVTRQAYKKEVKNGNYN